MAKVLPFRTKRKSAVDLSQVQVVILNCLYDNILNDHALSFFSKAVRLKILGYQERYESPVLPVDAGDFIGTHILLCQKSETGPIPIMGYKVLTLEQCERFHMEFPALHVVGGPQRPEHFASIEEYVRNAHTSKTSLAYVGSWTVKPGVMRTPGLARLCRGIGVCALVKHFEEAGIRKGITFAATRFGVEKFHAEMGFQRMAHAGKDLPTFKCEPFAGEVCQASVIDPDRFSDVARAYATEYERVWNDRMVIVPDSRSQKPAA